MANSDASSIRSENTIKTPYAMSLLCDGYIREFQVVMKPKIIPNSINGILLKYLFIQEFYKLLYAKIWISLLTNKISMDEPLMEQIRDGVILCDLLNVIKPGSCKKYKKSKIAFVARSNIQIFILAMNRIKLSNDHLFETRDLFDQQDLDAVVRSIYHLSNIAKKIDSFHGPFIDSEEVIKHKDNAIILHILTAETKKSLYDLI